uniref:Putative secreted protein n=1 Tax=Culex tarsalis TaxID=7177 RepID=A0A1Q3G2N1_CULTA
MKSFISLFTFLPNFLLLFSITNTQIIDPNSSLLSRIVNGYYLPEQQSISANCPPTTVVIVNNPPAATTTTTSGSITTLGPIVFPSSKK